MSLIYTLVFLGFFASALVAPVFSPLFLHPIHGGMLSATTSVATKALLLGTVLAAGRLGEFFGSPILGQLSDRYGRKQVLAIAMGVTAAGNLIIAQAIISRNVWLFIAGQFLIGFVGVLLVLVQSEIAQRSTEAEKTRRFGLVYMASGLAYVFAPAVGGHLSDVALYDCANYATPFFLSAGVCAVTVLLIVWRFPNSSPATPGRSMSVAKGLSEIGEAFHLAPFRALLLVNLVLYLGIDFVFQFNPVYFVQTWHFTSSEVGWFISYTSLAMVFAQWLLIGPVGRHWAPRAVTTTSAILLSLLLIVLVMPERWSWLYVILPAIGAVMALATTNMSALLSNTAPPDAQGRMLGVSHSARVIGSAFLCFGGGLLAGHSAKAPILAGALASLLAAGLLVMLRRRDESVV
jgi:predicted MFS family arabinose efflux permease